MRSSLVWVVATATAAETILQAIVAFLRDDQGELAVWVVGAVLIFGAGAFGENVKRAEGTS
jgi:hypothetical protein